MSREFRTAVILAGGKSQRMGFDKQAIKINGEYLIQLIIEKLKTIGFEAFIIVSNKPSFYVDLQLGDDVKVVVDAIEDCGPLGGIYTGLVHSRDQKVFFTACDMPELNESYIKYMMERIKKDEKAMAVVTKFGQWIEPFCGFYTKELAGDIVEYVAKGKRKIQPFLSEQSVIYIEEIEARKFSPDWKMFRNINTFEELIRFDSIYAKNIIE